MAEKDKEVVPEEKKSVEEGEGETRSEVKPEEREALTRNYPNNKYELAIVAAQEARRLNENWKDLEGEQKVRVTDKALEKVKKGEVHYFVDDSQPD